MPGDPDIQTEPTPEELLIAQILQREKAEQVDFMTLYKLEQFEPGDRIRIYRLAPRDIGHGKAAVLDMKLKKINKYNRELTFEGEYTDSAPGTETVNIPSGTLTVSLTGQTLQIFASELAKHLAGLGSQLVLFKITSERVLIFVEKDETGVLKRISDVIAGALGRALKTLRIR